jgi:hypothetical protein
MPRRLPQEKNHWRRFHWRYIIIDEAHRIKNENSRLSQVRHGQTWPTAATPPSVVQRRLLPSVLQRLLHVMRPPPAPPLKKRTKRCPHPPPPLLFAGGAHAEDQLPHADYWHTAAEQPARAVGPAQLPAA